MRGPGLRPAVHLLGRVQLAQVRLVPSCIVSVQDTSCPAVGPLAALLGPLVSPQTLMADACVPAPSVPPACRLPFWLIYFIALIVQYLVVPLMRLFGRELQVGAVLCLCRCLCCRLPLRCGSGPPGTRRQAGFLAMCLSRFACRLPVCCSLPCRMHARCLHRRAPVAPLLLSHPSPTSLPHALLPASLLPFLTERLHALPHRPLRRQPHLFVRRRLPRLWLCAKGEGGATISMPDCCVMACKRPFNCCPRWGFTWRAAALIGKPQMPLLHSPPRLQSQVPMDEALKRTLRHFSHLHAAKQKEG